MNARPLVERVAGALALAPMTTRELARCLCAEPGTVDHVLRLMAGRGEVTVVANAERISKCGAYPRRYGLRP